MKQKWNDKTRGDNEYDVTRDILTVPSPNEQGEVTSTLLQIGAQYGRAWLCMK
jgi:hypothetical protein